MLTKYSLTHKQKSYLLWIVCNLSFLTVANCTIQFVPFLGQFFLYKKEMKQRRRERMNLHVFDQISLQMESVATPFAYQMVQWPLPHCWQERLLLP